MFPAVYTSACMMLHAPAENDVGHAEKLRAFCSMLGASTRTQTAWLTGLELPPGMDLVALLGTADGRDAKTASLHAQVRNELVEAMEKVRDAEAGTKGIVCVDGTVIMDSPEHDIQAAKLTLDTARQSLLKVSEGARNKVLKSAEAAAATRARRASTTATVKYNDYTFTVRCDNTPMQIAAQRGLCGYTPSSCGTPLAHNGGGVFGPGPRDVRTACIRLWGAGSTRRHQRHPSVPQSNVAAASGKLGVHAGGPRGLEHARPCQVSGRGGVREHDGRTCTWGQPDGADGCDPRRTYAPHNVMHYMHECA